MQKVKLLILVLVISGCDMLYHMQNVGSGYTRINLKPMYGGVKKDKHYQKADKDFLEHCDKIFPSRDTAAKAYVGIAWKYYNKKQYGAAMRRFNQAWLLDSLNADVYWGFGSIQGERGKFKESVDLLNRSIELNPKNPIVWQSISISYGNLFFYTKDSTYLQKNNLALRESNRLYKSKNAQVLGQLVTSYYVMNKRDSVIKYTNKADALDPSVVISQVREYIDQ